MRINLKPFATSPTWFDWDPEAGTLTGPAADDVRETIEYVLNGRAGTVHDPSYARSFVVTDPLHDRADMAAVLFCYYSPLPENVLAWLPPLPPPEPENDDLPEGAERVDWIR